MKNEKRTDALFDAVGKIDPEFLMEAETAPKAVRTSPLRRALPIAAAVAALVVLTVILSVFLPKNGTNVLDGKEPGAVTASDDKSSLSDLEKEAVSMEEVFLAATEKAEILEGTPVTCRLQPGVAGIIWQTEADGPCYFHVLTSAQVRRLLSLGTNGAPVGPATSGTVLRVWLVDADGTVQTPYLRPGKGNEEFLRLQDYSPELIPSDAFIDALRHLLTGGQNS